MIALIVSLALAGLAAYGAFGYLSRPRTAPAPPAPAAKAPPPPPPKTFSQKIEKGMRAVTLEVDAVTGGSRELAPGDRVDVLAVAPIPDHPEGRVSRQLVSGARVMAVSAAEATGGRSARKWTVTLTVPAADASALATADPAAKLRLVVRHPKDDGAGDPAVTAFSPTGGITAYAPQNRDLDTLIARGMRAITLDVAPTDGVGGVFRPGDRVDIVVTCPWGNISLQSQDKPGEQAVLRETHRNARILLQDIRVIATDRSLAWDTDPNRQAGRVTLEVTPRDAERLTVLADSKKGKNIIRLISRNQSDHQWVQTPGAELLDLLSERRPYKRVEMIRGPQRKDQTFYR